MAHSAPVDSFRGNRCASVVLGDAGVDLFGVGPFFVHERHASKTDFQTRAKPIFWQVAFDTIALNTVGIHNQNGWCPKCFETMKPCWMLFDVGFERYKCLVDEICDCLVAV